jgi:hypothetical protein
VPAVRVHVRGNDAHRCVLVLSHLWRMPGAADAQGGGLLRVLLIRFGEMPSGSASSWVLLQCGGSMIQIQAARSNKAVETDAQGRSRLRRSISLGRRSLLR